MPRVERWIVLAGVSVIAGCGANELGGGADGFAAEEWDLVLELEPLRDPPEESPYNEHWDDDAAARLGQRLFFDKEFASAVRLEGPSGEVGETGRVACATCHDPDAYFSDPRPTGGMSHGTGYTTRNTPGLVNVAYYDWFNWGGRRDSLAAQGAGSPETGTNAASTRLFFAHVVYAKHKEQYETVFGPLDPALDPEAEDADRFPPAGRPKRSDDEPDGPWEMMAEEDQAAVNLIMANSGKAYEAYERRLISGSSPFSVYIQDQETDEFSPAARRGLKLFIGKAACNECHKGPVLSDNEFHNVGVPQAVGDAPAVDEGRFQDVPRLLSNPYNTAGRYSADPEAGMRKLAAADPDDESTKGQFRTSGLLNIAETGPYFHNGSARTLQEVVEHYNRGGGEPGSFSGELDPKIRPLGLSDEEVSDLVAFLRSLTGEPVPERWREDPFADE